MYRKFQKMQTVLTVLPSLGGRTGERLPGAADLFVVLTVGMFAWRRRMTTHHTAHFHAAGCTSINPAQSW